MYLGTHGFWFKYWVVTTDHHHEIRFRECITDRDAAWILIDLQDNPQSSGYIPPRRTNDGTFRPTQRFP